MKKHTIILLGAVALVLLIYGAWTTGQIIQLQARVARLQASHDVLVRGTYDFGAALTQLNRQKHMNEHDPALPTERARAILLGMRENEWLRYAIAGPRA